MEFKTGDKVRFLNEKGEGIITRILNNAMVNVAIEEGFEVPVMASELIKIEPQGMADRFFDRKVNVNIPDTPVPVKNITHYETPSVEPSTDRVTPVYRQSGAQTNEGLYLLYAPHDQNLLIAGNIDIFLVNHSSYDVLFSFLLKEDEHSFSGVDYDIVPPYHKILLETITREDLGSWSSGVVQAMFHRNEMNPVLSPLHAAFSVKPVRFYKESSYQDFRLLGSKALVLNLGDISGQWIISGAEELAKAGVEPALQKKVSAIAPPAFIDNHNIGSREAEVDLHISALREEYSDMSSNEILRYQVDYFIKMLDSAISNNYKKVVFIHGIGNGTLKSAIISSLADYENIELRSAPFAKYGYGAVEIIIHTNR